MKIVTESFFDFKAFRDYFFYLLFKRWPAKFMRILFILEVVALLILMISNGIINRTFDFDLFLLGLLVIAINSSYFLVVYFMARRLYKKNKKTYITPTIYQFEAHQFLIGLKHQNIQNGIKVDYKQVVKVEETKKYFFLFLANQRAHVLRKDIFQGDILQLRTLLVNYFGRNYILKCQ